MDKQSTRIYGSKQEALTDLAKKGVPPKEAEKRLVSGTKTTLRKLRKMIRKQARREAEGRARRDGELKRMKCWPKVRRN